MTGHSDIPKFREVLSGLENDGYFTAKSEKDRYKNTVVQSDIDSQQMVTVSRIYLHSNLARVSIFDIYNIDVIILRFKI